MEEGRGKYLSKVAPEIKFVQQIANDFFNASVDLERVPQGVSTFVYRIRIKDKTFYLRILPEQDASFAIGSRIQLD